MPRIVVVGAGPAGARCADHPAQSGAAVPLIGGEARQCVGLVAQSCAQAQVGAADILGKNARYVPVSDATALKVAGAGVWSAGEIEGSDPIVLSDAESGQYRRFLLRDDRLVGAMLRGEATDAPWYLSLTKEGRPIGPAPANLPFGPTFQPAEWAA